MLNLKKKKKKKIRAKIFRKKKLSWPKILKAKV